MAIFGMKGSDLHPDDQREVLRSYVYRMTTEAQRKWPDVARYMKAGGWRMPEISDSEWLNTTYFAVNQNGRLNHRHKRVIQKYEADHILSARHARGGFNSRAGAKRRRNPSRSGYSSKWESLTIKQQGSLLRRLGLYSPGAPWFVTANADYTRVVSLALEKGRLGRLERALDSASNRRSNPQKFDGQKVNLPAGTVAGDYPGLADRLRTIIQPGDIVEFIDHHGHRRRGRVVFRLPGHLTLNMGGRHGTPAVVYYEMVAKHIRSKRRHGG